LTECILHLGSNLGFKATNIELAELLIYNFIGEVTKVSQLYETEPWGNTQQDPFLNKALISNTNLNPEVLLVELHKIENKLGRKRKEKWGPRIIDIDIIFYGDKIVKNDDLIIPHPQATNRSFVLTPLMDICPEKLHPGLNKTIKQLMLECEDKGKVKVVNQDNQ